MDNLYCDGTEDELTSCRFDGWGQNDCDHSEAAGVICDEGNLADEITKVEIARKPVLYKSFYRQSF